MKHSTNYATEAQIREIFRSSSKGVHEDLLRRIMVRALKADTTIARTIEIALTSYLESTPESA